MTTIVIMPGGFHPFHAGHAALYNSIKRAFPDAEVFVAATNDTSSRPFPFPVKEKLAKLAGVEPGHFVQVRSPFKAEEITAHFDPEQDVLIFVRSEKDQQSQPKPGGFKKDGTPSYLQPLVGTKRLEPFSKHAYMAYLPTVEFGPGMHSATEIRSAWPKFDEENKATLVNMLYPKTKGNPALTANVVGLLDGAIGGELTEFARDGFNGDNQPKFIPWNDFIEGVKGIVGRDFDVIEKVIKSTIQDRFVPYDALEYGPTMLYSYYEARAGRGKGAVSTRGAIQVGKYIPNSSKLGTQNFISSFNILKGHPFERHFDLTPENISKVAAIIMGNTEGAYKVQPQQEVDENQGWAATLEAIPGPPTASGAGMTANYQRRENQPVNEKKGQVRDPELVKAFQYIKQHYPTYSGDPDLAMAKWLQRSLKHSQENDNRHDETLAILNSKIDALAKIVKARKPVPVQPKPAPVAEDYVVEARKK